MEKTKIDWCDATFNPVTGCRHGCEYCYARKIAERFQPFDVPHVTEDGVLHGINDLHSPIRTVCKDGKERVCAYPYGFEPTFHRYRLDDYKNKKGRNIFVCSMADLFGSWVPDEWIKEVFKACMEAPQHNYLFLTKNPTGIPRTSDLYTGKFGDHSDNMWFGTTITCQKDLDDRLFPLLQVRGHTFLSIEPLLERLDLSRIFPTEKDGSVVLSVPERMAYYLGGGCKYHMPEWIIIGAETGNRKEKVVPKRKWIEGIVNQCRKACIPVFMKSSLADIWGEPLIQEYPSVLNAKHKEYCGI